MNFIESLHPYFQERERENRFSGVVFVTQGANTLFAEAYGYASRAWNIPNTLDTRFDTASMTKIFTSVATLQMIEQGLLTFETSAIDHLGLEGTTISNKVNVYHLLTHTSGIGDDAEEDDGEDYEDLWKLKPNYSVINTEDFLPQIIHNPPNFPPGEGCRYCNVSYILLGLMIEKASGLPYREYVRRHVFERSGMQHSDFYRMDRVNEKVAEGCDPIYDEAKTLVGWKKNIYSYPPIGSPDGGAHVTAGDVDIFLRAIQTGKLLSAELTQDMITPKVFYRENEIYSIKLGYGLEFLTMKANGLTFYEKEGINAGVSGMMRCYPEQDINMILLSNMQNGVWEPVRKVHEMVVEEYMS